MIISQALTIAGSDSGGGAGIQADLKTFEELGVYGMSVITAVTAQNTCGVKSIHKVPVNVIIDQLEAIRTDLLPKAIKTGMLADKAIIQAVANQLSKFINIPIVIDPVMMAKGGTTLLEQDAITALRKKLLPLATIITPNLPEAEALLETEIITAAEIERSAEKLLRLGPKAVIIKGGHSQFTQAADFFCTKNERFWLISERFETMHTHGTGCTFSACIAAELAKGASLSASANVAKKFITSAIQFPLGFGHGHGPTNHFAYKEQFKK